MKKFIVQCGLASALALSAASAMAGGVNWSVNIGVGGYYPPPPVYYSPPPYNNYSNYYAPPVIYGNAVPVYQAPPPVIYGPVPVIVYGYQGRPYYPGPRHDHYRDGYERGHREYRDYHR